MQILTNNRRVGLKSLQKILRIRFSNLDLLDRAFTHRSYCNEQKYRCANYERLEFLGDSLLGFVVSEYLYKKFPDLDEGHYSKIKAVVVSELSLSKIAKALHFDQYILIGKGEEANHGREKKAILEDTFEAVIGAYYIDCRSLTRVRNFVLRFIGPEVQAVIDNHYEKDYKTLLQELCQKDNGAIPSYKVIKEEGPEHDKQFTVSVSVDGKQLAEGHGSSKKYAEKEAAERAYRKLTTSVETKVAHRERSISSKNKSQETFNKPNTSENAPREKKFYENIDFENIHKSKSRKKKIK